MTNRMKWLLLGSVAGAFLLALPVKANAQTAVAAAPGGEATQAAISPQQAFVTKATSEGLAFLSDTSLSKDQKRAKFSALLNRNFDLDTIGKFALGPYWRTATPDEQAQYLKLFKNMVVEVYTNRFEEYNGEKLTVASSKPLAKNDTVVTSYILPTNGSGEKVQVDWRVRTDGNSMRVVDVIVEGVSMSMTQRSEFSSVIQRGGGSVGALITHLQGQIKTARAS